MNNKTNTAPNLELSRRGLLKAGGAIIVNFALGARNAAAQAVPVNLVTARGALDVTDVDSFLMLHADGSVTVHTGKVDLGTGLRVAIRQMAAEELDVPLERVSLVDGDTGLTPDQGSTGGSTGLTRGGVEVRQAAATARAAMEKLGTGVQNGKTFKLKVDPKAPLKDPKTYTVVGKPVPRLDLPNKITARHTYVQDVVVPGMLHGRVIRPPALAAKLLSVDEASIRAIPDTRVVRMENFLAVVAKNEWAAIRAARDLKVTWSQWEGIPSSDAMEPYLRAAADPARSVPDQAVATKGDVSTAMSSSAKKFSASYYWPNQSHASLGPSCAVADVRADGATLWSSTQSPHGTRDNLAKIFGMPKNTLRLVYTDGAGCYGGNGNDDVAAEAILLSKTVGAPVRVQWMRQDEHGWDPKGPQQLLDIRASLDAQGNIAAWDAEMWVPANVPGARPLLSIDAAGLPQDHGQGAGLMTQNADPPIAAANVRVVAHMVKDTPLRPSNLRAPGKIANSFAVESMMDELAEAAGVDPVEFRLRGLTDPRAMAVVKKAAELFGWQRRTARRPQSQGNLMIGTGFSYVRYKQAENYVAMAMEVSVDRTTGQVKARRVACAHDCGLVVNPDALRNQIEGLVIQTLSRTLHEEVKFDKSRVTNVDWSTYPILRMTEAPSIEIALLDHPEIPLNGAGEAAAVTVPGAVAGAIYDATGIRLRRAPFTAERVAAAIKGS
ncbi:MAG: molybdopterin cofactor-binding domain-containing protein [Bryobacteraceae bacterium]